MLSDGEIVNGFRKGKEQVVRDYFYPYCQMAYVMMDRHYQLRLKPDMDFMSLAHEYYLRLVKDNFSQLDQRHEVSLRTWMVAGFRYLVLDRLKALSAHRKESFEDRLAKGAIRYNQVDETLEQDVRDTVADICDNSPLDRRDRTILYSMLIAGFSGKEMSVQLGISPSAISQRYKKLMRDVVKPYFINYFEGPRVLGSVMPDAVGPLVENIVKPIASKPCSGCTPPPSEELGEASFIMQSNRISPDRISSLQPGEVFVFGSNLEGMHGGGAAYAALRKFGARLGQGVGMQGQSYAIPTMQGGVETIAPYVDEFIAYAKAHPELRFLVTRIGCGIAGFTPADIAPLFAAARDVQNIALPQDFWDELA